MNVDAMVVAGAEALASRNSSSNVDSFMGISRAVVNAALSARVQEVAEGWSVSSNNGSVLIYCLKQDGWRKGEPLMVNDIMIRVENANGSSNELQPIVDDIMRALPEAPKNQES